MSTHRTLTRLEGLEPHVDYWVGRHLITADQAGRILATEADCPREVPSPSVPVGRAQVENPVAEALGYVGGVLVFVGAVVIVAENYTALGRSGRLGLAAGVAVALGAAGELVGRWSGGSASGRLRSVLWALATAAVAVFLGLVADESLRWPGEDVAFLAGSGAALVGVPLWYRHRWVLQQAAVVAMLAVALGSGVAALVDDGDAALSGLAIWGLGVVWLMLGWGGHVQPRYATDLLGGTAVMIGSQVAIKHAAGAVLAVATAAGLAAMGVRLRAMVLVAVGSVATFLAVPGVLGRYFPDTVVAPLSVLAAGVLLVVAAVIVARRPRVHRPGGAMPLPGLGSATIVGVALTVGLAVIVLARF